MLAFMPTNRSRQFLKSRVCELKSWSARYEVEKVLICYCFGYSEEDVIKDMADHKGTSTILERILNEKKQGTCNCSTLHPLGR